MDKVFTCRFCKKPFIAKEEDMGNTWFLRSQGYAYHIDCWNKLRNIHMEKNSDEWFDLIFDLIVRDLHSTYNFFLIKRQCEKMLESGKTMKGIYFTCYWYFVVQGKEYQPKFGIGIIPYVYDQSIQYWSIQQEKEKDLLVEIENLKRIEAGKGTHIAANRKRKKRKAASEPVL